MTAETIHRIDIRKKLREQGKEVEADQFFLQSNKLDIDGIDELAETFGIDVKWNEEIFGAKKKPKKQPFCWKCVSKITESNGDGSSSLTGCKEEEKIHNYSDAEKFCPLIGEENV